MSVAMAVAINSEAISGPVNSAVALKRPNGGKKWSEVCEQVQKPDGSVRIHLTSPPFKNNAAPTNSPPHLRRVSQHLSGKKKDAGGSCGRASSTTSRGGSSRGGSSRGRSSRISSDRSSSREIAREGDISSCCSSGGCGWDTSTNSSEHMSRDVDTPREDAIADILGAPSASPLSCKSLLMPDPIRPLALLVSEHGSHVESHVSGETSDPKATDACIAAAQDDTCYEARLSGDGSPIAEVQTSRAEVQDPFGRDAPRGGEVSVKSSKSSWSVEPLAKYLKRVAQKIESNINNDRLPTEKKLDAFVANLVTTLHRQLRHAPKNVRHNLTQLCAYRFDRFHDFIRNERLMTPSPEELKLTLMNLVEGSRQCSAWPNSSHIACLA